MRLAALRQAIAHDDTISVYQATARLNQALAMLMAAEVGCAVAA
jgi:hypothetical protein